MFTQLQDRSYSFQEYPESPVSVKSNYNPLPRALTNSTEKETSPTDKVSLWKDQLEVETQSNDHNQRDSDILQEGSPKGKTLPDESNKKGASYAAQFILTPKNIISDQEIVDHNKNKNEQRVGDDDVNQQLSSSLDDSNDSVEKTPSKFFNILQVSMCDEHEDLRKDNRPVKYGEREIDVTDTEMPNDENDPESTRPTQKHQKLTKRDERTINTTINKKREKSCDFLAKNKKKKNRPDKTQFNTIQSEERVEPNSDENLTLSSDKSILNGTFVTDHPEDVSDLNSTYTVSTIDGHNDEASNYNERLNEIDRDDQQKTEPRSINAKDCKRDSNQKNREKEAKSKKNVRIDEKDEKSHVKTERTNAHKKTVKKSASRKPTTELQKVADTPKEGSDTGEQHSVNKTGNLHQNVISDKEKCGRGSKSQKKRETLSEIFENDTEQRRSEVELSLERPVSKIPRKKRNVKISEANEKTQQSKRLVESISGGTDDTQKENRKGKNDTKKKSQKEENCKKQEDEVEKKPTRSRRAAAKAASVKISETAYSDLSSPKRKRGRPRKK